MVPLPLILRGTYPHLNYINLSQLISSSVALLAELVLALFLIPKAVCLSVVCLGGLYLYLYLYFVEKQSMIDFLIPTYTLATVLWSCRFGQI